MVSESLESYEFIAIQIVPLLIYPFLPSKETVTTQDLPLQPVSNTGEEWRASNLSNFSVLNFHYYSLIPPPMFVAP